MRHLPVEALAGDRYSGPFQHLRSPALHLSSTQAWCEWRQEYFEAESVFSNSQLAFEGLAGMLPLRQKAFEQQYYPALMAWLDAQQLVCA